MKEDQLKGLVSFLVTPKNSVGIQLTKFLLGFTMIWLYIVKLKERYTLWGPENLYNREQNGFFIFNIYSYITNNTVFNIIYFTGLIVTILFTFGYFSFISGPAFFIFTASLYNQNSFILTGGNNILLLIAYFLAFMWGKPSYNEEIYEISWSLRRELVGLLHNFGLLACRIQICIMYFFAGLYKSGGDMWLHGTALYYVLRVEEFILPGVSHLIYSNPYLVTVGTYATLIFQISFPFLIWFKKLKPYMFIMAVLFHSLIGIIMGLTWFSIQMVAVDILFFNINSTKPLHYKIKKLKDRFRIKRFTLRGGGIDA